MNILKFSFYIFFSFFYLSSALYAVPQQQNNLINEISAEKLQKLIYERADIIIIDVRREIDYLCGRIAAAKSAPIHNLLLNDYSYDSTLVFYCANSRCIDSKKAAAVAQSKGFKNIYVYTDGFQDWIKKKLPLDKTIDISAIDLKKIKSVKPGDLAKESDNFIILDFLNDSKYGSINNSLIIGDPADLKNIIHTFDRKKKIAVYHLTGNLSKTAAAIMLANGIKNEINYLEGGLLNWLATGRKTVIKKTDADF